MLDVARAREETPGCAGIVHLNNAGAALPPQPVLETVINHLEEEARVGGYEAAAAGADRLEAVYDSIARLIGCDADEVALVENATRAWDMAFYAQRFRPGDRILTARSEYASNVIALLQVAARTGVVIETIPDDEYGQLSVTALADMIDDRVRLIAISHIPTSGGLVNPAAAVGAVARARGILFLLDACQSVGQMPVDVRAIGCDMLSAAGRKFLRGPRGTGFLYVRRGLIQQLDPPLLDLHAATWTGPDSYVVRADARRFETWEGFVAGKLGLGVAAEYAMAMGLPAIRDRVRMLAEHARERLAALPGITVQDQGLERCGIVTFTSDREAPQAIKARLARRGINVSVPVAAHAQFDLGRRGLDSVVRASPHYYNTEAELECLCAALAD